MFAQKKDRAERCRVDAEPQIEPVRGEALDDEAAAERVQREQRRRASSRRRAIGRAPRGRRASRETPSSRRASLASAARDSRENSTASTHAERRVQHHHRAVAAHGRHRAPAAARASACPPASAPSAVANEPASVYQANTSVLRPIGHDVRERRLLDRQKRSDFVAARADDADGAGERRAARDACVEAKTSPAAAISSAPTISIRRRPIRSARVVRIQRDDGVADERQRQQQAGLRFAQAEADQIEHQHHRQRAVGEQPDESRGEQQPAIAG